MHGLKPNTMYRIFKENITIFLKSYCLSSAISIDEFKATSDKGKYAFHIADSVKGKTLDIIEDRKASSLRNYFIRMPFIQWLDYKLNEVSDKRITNEIYIL